MLLAVCSPPKGLGARTPLRVIGLGHRFSGATWLGAALGPLGPKSPHTVCSPILLLLSFTPHPTPTVNGIIHSLFIMQEGAQALPGGLFQGAQSHSTLTQNQTQNPGP